MKISNSIYWGIVLIGAGLLGLAQQLRYLDRLAPQVWSAVFAGISILAFIMYLVSGWQSWSWLFPVGIFGGLAVTTLLATSGINKPIVGMPLFVGLLIPFAAAYAIDRARNWWALIPGGVMLFLALTTALVDSTGGPWVGALFLFMLAFGFLVAYLNNRSRTWTLLVAYIFFVLGIAPLMAMRGSQAAYYGPNFLFAVALPFFVVYFRSPARWWAIIPAGALTIIAVITALAISGALSSIGGVYANTLIMGGLALTFALVWLRNAKPWAKIVAIVLVAIALVSALAASYANYIAPVAIIVVGGYLLFTALRRKPAEQEKTE